MRNYFRGRSIVSLFFGGRGPACRRFTLMDAMILIGGVALGFAGARGRLRDADISDGVLDATFELVGYGLMVLSGLMLILRLRRPRPPIRRVLRQPGAAACFAVVAYGLLFDVECLLRRRTDLASVFKNAEEGIWFLIEAPSSQFALMVPVLWMVMALGGRWRPEAGWIDRAGRALALGWIAWEFAGPFRS